jgi:hypothetical protein
MALGKEKDGVGGCVGVGARFVVVENENEVDQ